MRPDVANDFEWADGYGSQINRILTANVGVLVNVETASAEQDIRRATDLVVSVPQGEVAVRIRRDNITYRDLTLRYRRRRGTEWSSEFEVAKILAGFARWYFYAWAKGFDIGEWILVDLDTVRMTNLIEDAIEAGREKPNTDGRTTFTWITLDELHQVGAIVAENVNTGRRRGPAYEEVVADFTQRPLHSHCSCAACRAKVA